MMKAVHFGAGNIGRGFIGQLLFHSGFELIFADVNKDIIDLLKRSGSYHIHYAEEPQRSEEISGYIGLHSLEEKEALEKELADADIITTAVGAPVLKHIAPAIAEGLRRRLNSKKPAAVIACENAVNGTDQLKSHIEAFFSEDEWKTITSFVSFPNAAVDRIVPVQSLENPLDVLVEPFYEWTIDRTGFVGDIPAIKEAHYVDNLDAYIERKLFTVNTGHAAAAYYGYEKGYKTVQEAMADEKIRMDLKQVLQETGDLLIEKYGFDVQEHEAYIDTTLSRFQNPMLTDQITRVARQPLKKLGAGERLISPALQLFSQGKEAPGLTGVIASALRYDEDSDEEAVQLQKLLHKHPIKEALHQITGLPANHLLHQKIAAVFSS
jgi:mannitol-1-phosphate 5-dehydrogenase